MSAAVSLASLAGMQPGRISQFTIHMPDQKAPCSGELVPSSSFVNAREGAVGEVGVAIIVCLPHKLYSMSVAVRRIGRLCEV
jgi:hypothetical protein